MQYGPNLHTLTLSCMYHFELVLEYSTAWLPLEKPF